jgi:hypothetical protein
VNASFISFSSYSATFASVTCFIVGYLFLYAPFAFLNLINKNRKQLRKSDWVDRFGLLTDDLEVDNIVCCYYYPLFMYERMIIAAIIVFMQTWPSL